VPVEWRLRRSTLSTAHHTLIMGVLNVTPDSFSDGGLDADDQAAIERGLALRQAGADIVDVGGESTRPGAAPIDIDTEISRVLPVVAGLAAAGVVVSIDTMKPEVAVAAVAAGAEIINDVGGLRDPAMVATVAALEAAVVIMHMRGGPLTMQADTEYADLVGEVVDYLETQAANAIAAGIDRDRICIDPGIGFGKGHVGNLEILDNAPTFAATGFPVMIGASRKGFLGSILESSGLQTSAAERDSATAATVSAAVIGGAAVVRVHDVATALQAARTTDAIVRGHF